MENRGPGVGGTAKRSFMSFSQSTVSAWSSTWAMSPSGRRNERRAVASFSLSTQALSAVNCTL